MPSDRGTAALAALLGIALTGCLALPPSRTEMSAFAHGPATGYRVAAGGHSASAPARLDARIDLGAGYVYEQVDGQAGQHGNYIELSRQLWRHGRTRAFAGGRVEVFWNDVGELGTTRAASARLAIERVAGHVAGGLGDRSGAAAIYGLFAPGMFVEAGLRGLQRGDVAGGVTAGIYVRLPFVLTASRPTLF